MEKQKQKQKQMTRKQRYKMRVRSFLKKRDKRLQEQMNNEKMKKTKYAGVEDHGECSSDRDDRDIRDCGAGGFR